MKRWLSILAASALLIFVAGAVWAGDCHLSDKAAASTAEAAEAPADAKPAGCQADGGCCGVGACADKQAQAADGGEAQCPCGRNKPKQDG